jgi:hypothetical protein
VGCLIAIASAVTPRLVLIVMWLTDYTTRAFESGLWPTIGFFVLPTTTVGWAIASNELSSGGQIRLGGVIVIVIGLVLDLGLVGGSARARRKR